MPGSLARLAVFLLLIVGVLTPAHAAKRVVLVIGNGSYEHATPLRNPENDAKAIAAKLAELGFDVVTGVDLTHRGFAETISQFRRKLDGADVALFFYAGHGLQVNGQNYLAPIDAQLEDETALAFEAVQLRTIVALMERRRRTNIVFLDACRDNPLARNLARSMGTRSQAIGRGLARMETGVGTLIAFATQPGNVALDGDRENSPFTQGLVKHIATPGLDVALMIRRVRQDVIDATGGRQIPWQHSSLTDPFMFKDAVAAEPVQQTRPQFGGVERDFWRTAEQIGTIEAYRAYLSKYPDGDFAPLARIRIAQIEAERGATQTARLTEGEPAPVASAPSAPALPASPGETVDTPKPVEVAALSKSDDTGTAEAKPDPRALALALQTELKRVGCEPGRLDGQWGRKGRAALARFNRYAKLSLPGDQPSLQAIDALKEKKTRVCPVQVVKPKPVKKKATQTVQKKAAQTVKKPTTTEDPEKYGRNPCIGGSRWNQLTGARGPC